jgi:phosphonate transport system permease protein
MKKEDITGNKQGSTQASHDSPVSAWRLPHPYGTKHVAIVIVLSALLWFTGQRVEIGKMFVMTGEAILDIIGIVEGSQVKSGLGQVVASLLPLQIAEKTEISRIENFDRNKLPWLSRIEVEEDKEYRLNPETLQMETVIEKKELLIEPVGYLWRVILKMFETLEIALWGTIVSVMLSLPLSFFAARNYSPNIVTYHASRGIISFFRAFPELISALFLVLAFGFGPTAGILALGIHCAGFLGKFYAEDIENADTKPQEALKAIGANKIKILWYAVLPQVLPQYIAYTLYILDRNVRMATVIGIVGAGGIGQELKGRFDMFNYSHVGTILAAIFVTVFILDQVSARLRSKYI